jgi:hypothetical protein
VHRQVLATKNFAMMSFEQEGSNTANEHQRKAKEIRAQKKTV